MPIGEVVAIAAVNTAVSSTGKVWIYYQLKEKPVIAQFRRKALILWARRLVLLQLWTGLHSVEIDKHKAWRLAVVTEVLC